MYIMASFILWDANFSGFNLGFLDIDDVFVKPVELFPNE